MSSHLFAFLYHQLNLGKFADAFASRDLIEQALPTLRQAQGFYPRPEGNHPSRQAFLKRVPAYLKEVNDLKAWQPTIEEETGLPYLASNKTMLIQYMRKVVETAGAEPIFIESPAPDIYRPYIIAQQLGLIGTLLAYRNPNKFPQLYRIDRRNDRAHLTGQGAREFTKLLAQDFIQTIQP